MCGLTGILVNPKNALYAQQIEQLQTVFTDLLERTEERGNHATGVAALASRGPTVLRRAMPARAFVKLNPFADFLDDAARARASILLGHTRYGTMGANIDTNAHPFTAERVIGAHNGIIQNHREVEARVKADRIKGKRKLFPAFNVDSEAAFAALDTYKEPQEALALLRGYFALTWIRGGSFFAARTPDAPLTCVYVPEYRALFYNSERDLLLSTLRTWGIKFDMANVYDPTPGQIYRYVPTQFDATGTNVTKIGEWKCVERAPRGFDSSKPNQRVASANERTVPTFHGKISSRWTSDDADAHFQRRLRDTAPLAHSAHRRTKARDDDDAQYAGSDSWNDANSTHTMRERLFDAEAEIARLRTLIARMDRKLARLVPDADVVDAREHVPTQAELDLDAFASGGTCAVCGFGATTTRPLVVVNDHVVHVNCASGLTLDDDMTFQSDDSAFSVTR